MPALAIDVIAAGQLVPMHIESVNDFDDAAGLVFDFLVEGVDLLTALTLMGQFYSAREAEVCLCSNPECGNVILPVDLSPGLMLAITYVASV